jgi:hypothetical protein
LPDENGQQLEPFGQQPPQPPVPQQPGPQDQLPMAPQYGAPQYQAPQGPQYQQVQGQPMQQPAQALPAGPVLVTIGDISVEQYRIVTPAGVLPTQGTNWSAMDMTRTEEKIPAYAIVLAIIFFLFCLLGLLFLLIKERKTTGFVQVTVQHGNRTHNTHVAAANPTQVADTLARVNYARTLCV